MHHDWQNLSSHGGCRFGRILYFPDIVKRREHWKKNRHRQKKHDHVLALSSAALGPPTGPCRKPSDCCGCPDQFEYEFHTEPRASVDTAQRSTDLCSRWLYWRDRHLPLLFSRQLRKGGIASRDVQGTRNLRRSFDCLD